EHGALPLEEPAEGGLVGEAVALQVPALVMRDRRAAVLGRVVPLPREALDGLLLANLEFVGAHEDRHAADDWIRRPRSGAQRTGVDLRLGSDAVEDQRLARDGIAEVLDEARLHGWPASLASASCLRHSPSSTWL